jgi:hypothetical protein
MLCIFRFALRKGGNYTRCHVVLCAEIPLIYFGILLSSLMFSPLFNGQGVIIKGNNNSDVMFQYLDNFGSDSNTYPKAYPIFLRLDGINDTCPNSTPEFVPFSTLCPIFGPLRTTNLSGAFKCHSDDINGLEPFLLYLEPLLGLSHIAMNLCISFLIFFGFGYFLMMIRRLLPPDQWFEGRWCRSSFGMLGETTPLM